MVAAFLKKGHEKQKSKNCGSNQHKYPHYYTELPQASHKVFMYLSPNYSLKAAWTGHWPIDQLKQL